MPDLLILPESQTLTSGSSTLSLFVLFTFFFSIKWVSCNKVGLLPLGNVSTKKTTIGAFLLLLAPHLRPPFLKRSPYGMSQSALMSCLKYRATNIYRPSLPPPPPLSKHSFQEIHFYPFVSECRGKILDLPHLEETGKNLLAC